MTINYNHITRKAFLVLVILIAFILIPSIKSNAAITSTTSTTINKNNTYTDNSKYTAVCKDFVENSDLYCVEQSQTDPWSDNPQQEVTYTCIGSVDVDTTREISSIVKKTGKCSVITDDECLKIAYALATKNKYFSQLKEGIEKAFDFNVYKGSYKYPDYHRAIAKNPWSGIMWDLHGASKNKGVEKYIETLGYFEPKDLSAIGVVFGVAGAITDVNENALTLKEIEERTDIKEVQTTVQTYYNIEEENQNLASKIKGLPNKSKPNEYIVIGPYKYNASKGDYISNIQVKKNGQKTYEEIHENIIEPSKILVLSKQLNGEYEITYSDTEQRIGNDILPEFYVLVKKDSNIKSIDDLKITIVRRNYKAKWYYFEGTNPSQALMAGNGKMLNVEKSLNYKVNLIPPVQVELNKVDTAKAAVEGAQFSITYSNGLKGETKTVGKDGKITFSQIQPTSPDEFTATITETYTPAGYKPLDKPIVLTFTYDQNNAIWKVTKTSGPSEKVEIGTVSKDSKSGINKIPVTVENKSIIEKLTILKTSSVGVEAVAGAKFKLTLTNVTSIKGYQLPTTAGEKTIFVTTDEKGNIVLEDIEITDLSKNVTIEIEETEAPVGYKKIDGKITVTLKREGNTYTVSETKKDNTVIDDEFQAGKVTLTNHELILNIKDIPVMNLGGIVWAEDEKTGKAPTSSDIYGDGNSEEALGGITVRLLDKNDNVIATTKTAERDNTEVKYLNNTGKESTVYLNKGQYLFTKLDDGTNYITVGTDYKVEIDYDGIKYNALMNTNSSVLYTKNGKSKITSENDHGLADATKTISGTKNEAQSETNGGYIIDYTLESNENTPDKAIYLKTSKDGQQAYVTAKSEKYLNKTEDWKSGWKNNNGVGEINLDNYAFDINFGLYVKRFDLNLGTDVDSATVSINGQTSTYTYDQILDGMLNDDLEKMYRTTDGEVDYNLYLAYSDYNYRIDDYKVPGTDNSDSLGQPYGEALLDKKDKNTELQVYVTYTLQINNQSTQHNATGVKVKYSYDEGYEYVESDGNVKDIGNNVLEISGINVAAGEKKQITLTFKVRKNDNGSFVKQPSDTSKYTNVAEIVEYSTTEGRLVDADSAPGNTFLGENKPTDRREDDTDTANGIVITFKKKEAERSISGKVFEDNEEKDAVNDVIVQLIELVEINNKQYEYIWQETVAGSNTVKTTATSGYPGPTYNVSNEAGEYKFTERIIPGNYIVRFIYGDGTYFDKSIDDNDTTVEAKNNIKVYNGEDYKSTYVYYKYNEEWYNKESLNEGNSKAVDNEARRLKVMSYAVDVDGNIGKKLDLLDANIGGLSEEEKKILTEEVIPSTWMCAETLKIKMPVDSTEQKNIDDTTIIDDGSNPSTENTQFTNVNFGLMERPKTKLVLEKHITGLTVKPVASGVNLIANATADINKILDATAGETIELEGQQDGLIAIKSGRTNRGTWYLQTDTTELAQGADAYITYTYVIKNEGDEDYLNKDLVEFYNTANIKDYATKLSDLETEVKNAKKQVTGTAYTNGTYISNFYYTGHATEKDKKVLASVEQIQESLNPKVKFLNSTTDFSKTDRNSNIKYAYYDTNGNMQENDSSINEIITSTTGTGKMELNSNDTSKKLVVSVGLSASEIENGGVYDSYIAEVTHYTNAAGRRDQSTPANLSYVHSYDTNKTLEDYNEEDEFWAERFIITKPTGEDKLTAVQIAIISVSAVVILGVGIILIKKFVLKK